MGARALLLGWVFLGPGSLPVWSEPPGQGFSESRASHSVVNVRDVRECHTFVRGSVTMMCEGRTGRRAGRKQVEGFIQI